MHIRAQPLATSSTTISLARRDTANCTQPQFEWTYNMQHQDPCNLAQQIQNKCVPGYSVPPLSQVSFQIYEPGVNPCACNSVIYSLISACTLCQGGSSFLKWSEWKKRCSLPAVSGFPPERDDVIDGIDVPTWTYDDVETQDCFNWHTDSETNADDETDADNGDHEAGRQNTTCRWHSSTHTQSTPGSSASIPSATSLSTATLPQFSTTPSIIPPRIPSTVVSQTITTISEAAVTQDAISSLTEFTAAAVTYTTYSAVSTQASESGPRPITSSSNNGAAPKLIGGIIAGVVVFLLLCLGLFCWLRQRRRWRSAPSAIYRARYGPLSAPHAHSQSSDFARQASSISHS